MITVKDNKTLKVGETLEKIMAHIGMIQPDMALIERFPALKSAHEEYQSQFAAALAAQNPDLKAAIDSYKMIAALVKDEPEDDSDG